MCIDEVSRQCESECAVFGAQDDRMIWGKVDICRDEECWPYRLPPTGRRASDNVVALESYLVLDMP